MLTLWDFWRQNSNQLVFEALNLKLTSFSPKIEKEKIFSWHKDCMTFHWNVCARQIKSQTSKARKLSKSRYKRRYNKNATFFSLTWPWPLLQRAHSSIRKKKWEKSKYSLRQPRRSYLRSWPQLASSGSLDYKRNDHPSKWTKSLIFTIFDLRQPRRSYLRSWPRMASSRSLDFKINDHLSKWVKSRF